MSSLRYFVTLQFSSFVKQKRETMEMRLLETFPCKNMKIMHLTWLLRMQNCRVQCGFIRVFRFQPITALVIMTLWHVQGNCVNQMQIIETAKFGHDRQLCRKLLRVGVRHTKKNKFISLNTSKVKFLCQVFFHSH